MFNEASRFGRPLLETGYPEARLHFVRGAVEETLPGTSARRELALLRLDTDWYESTRHELEHLYPRLVDGGVLIIDDYGHWEGSAPGRGRVLRRYRRRRCCSSGSTTRGGSRSSTE